MFLAPKKEQKMQFSPTGLGCKLYTQPNNHLSIDHARCANNINFIKLSYLSENKSYTPITGCVLEHILNTTNLTNHEKLYYLLADSLALINSNSGKHRAIALPSEGWATRLGCCHSQIFAMQKSLEKKGYFIISKDKNEYGQNKRNLIIPTLPNSIFEHLTEKFPDKLGQHLPYNPLTECKRTYLDRTKLFINLNYKLLEIIVANEYLNSLQKTIWLDFYTKCYKNYMFWSQKNSNISTYRINNDYNFSFISSYLELASAYSCNKKHLSKSIKILAELNFIKTEHFYTRKKHEYDCTDQDRQDQRLWKITLSLPDDYAIELKQIKDRANLKLTRNIRIYNHHKPNLVSDSLSIETTKGILEKSSSLKSIIDNSDTLSLPDDYIDSIIAELEVLEDLKYIDSDISTKTPPTLDAFNHQEENDSGISSDPHVAKFRPLLNKYLKLKIKDIKSNLRATPKVFFNKFLRRFKQGDYTKNEQQLNMEREFNIYSELIREKLKLLPKDKADKARKFAYSLISKRLATGYAAGLTKHQLAKQLIHHAASWKPTKLGNISREQQIDTALAIAWKTIIAGTWQMPLELAKAEILQYEFSYYKRKYQESGILSQEIKPLESVASSLLKRNYDLVGIITKAARSVVNHVSNAEGLSNLQNVRSIDKPFTILFNRADGFAAGTISSEVPANMDYQLEWDNCQQYSTTTSFNADSDNQMDCQVVEKLNNYNFDLSHLTEEQTYLKILSNEQDNLISIVTTNQKEYFVQLKMLETNEHGELVMTLRPGVEQHFAKLFVEEFVEEVEFK